MVFNGLTHWPCEYIASYSKAAAIISAALSWSLDEYGEDTPQKHYAPKKN